ncbi:MAG TPA: DUF4259 domain-containing protein [Acidimicrobiia bacterium]|jgi:hypothetical protein
MGAWGYGPFDNDDAADWVYELEQCANADEVTEVLTSVVSAPGYLLAPLGSVGLAAAEVVATATGTPGDALPTAVLKWIRDHQHAIDASLRQLAAAVVDRVLGDDSEVADLWDDEADRTWRASGSDLGRRLSASYK